MTTFENGRMASTSAPARKRPVDTVELKDAILEMIAKRFSNRTLDMETASTALQMVGFELRQLALFRP